MVEQKGPKLDVSIILKKMRLENDMSIREFAADFGISPLSVWEYENNGEISELDLDKILDRRNHRFKELQMEYSFSPNEELTYGYLIYFRDHYKWSDEYRIENLENKLHVEAYDRIDMLEYKVEKLEAMVKEFIASKG
jgi:transcriptional regulator with XRE-family HTH domain